MQQSQGSSSCYERVVHLPRLHFGYISHPSDPGCFMWGLLQSSLVIETFLLSPTRGSIRLHQITSDQNGQCSCRYLSPPICRSQFVYFEVCAWFDDLIISIRRLVRSLHGVQRLDDSERPVASLASPWRTFAALSRTRYPPTEVTAPVANRIRNDAESYPNTRKVPESCPNICSL